MIVEDPGVVELEFGLLLCAPPGFFDERGVGEGTLGVFVEILEVRVRGGAVEVEVLLFDILAVIPFIAIQAEQAFLENRVLAVPEGPA